MSSDEPSQLEQVDASKARRSLRNGFITLVLALALAVGLLLAVPGLKGVATPVVLAYQIGYLSNFIYHVISLWVPAIWGTVAFVLLQKTKKQPIVLRSPPEELRAKSS